MNEVTMHKLSFPWRHAFGIVVSLVVMASAPVLATPTRKAPPSNLDMSLHHVHTLLGEGLVAVLQGANLVMLSDMGMAPGLDETTRSHGEEMVGEGKSLVEQALSGGAM